MHIQVSSQFFFGDAADLAAKLVPLAGFQGLTLPVGTAMPYSLFQFYIKGGRFSRPRIAAFRATKMEDNSPIQVPLGDRVGLSTMAA